MTSNTAIDMETLLKANDIHKLHTTDSIETTALNGVSLEVRQEDFIAVMGPSGCGKSTLLNILGLIDTPNRGEYYFAGQETTQLSEAERANLRKGEISFVFQSFNLIDELTVYENVELPLLYLKVPSKDRKERVRHTLERMRMMHRKSHYPQQLSGGQQQRVAIARAVVTQPSLILADEPTGNLDSENGKAVMELMKELNKQGTTIVMVTHSAHDASYASRIVNLFDGHILSQGNRPI